VAEWLLVLRRKPFAILRYLVAHPKKLVTYEELLAQVWRGAVVSESSVRSHMHELRQVLGDGVIETVTGRGYRFMAELGDEVRARSPGERARRSARRRPRLRARRAGRRARSCAPGPTTRPSSSLVRREP
jgi:DNA-binding winged helix-turn-helix (wHTH) protein